MAAAEIQAKSGREPRDEDVVVRWHGFWHRDRALLAERAYQLLDERPRLVLRHAEAEAIVGPRDLVPYLGTGRRHGKVSDLAYHNVLMVLLWSALASGRVALMTSTLRAMPPVPPGAGWLTYVRCHDDIGWAIDDDDAAAVGWSGPGHRARETTTRTRATTNRDRPDRLHGSR